MPPGDQFATPSREDNSEGNNLLLVRRDSPGEDPGSSRATELASNPDSGWQGSVNLH
jgi:hypothetical protein